VKYGLVVMRKSPRLGLQKLCKSARVEQRSITEDDIGFMLAPRVNAASRMGDPRDAFTLFTTTDESEADLLAKKLESVNRSRKAAAGAITRAVHEKLEKRTEPLGSVIALGDPDWRPGLLGLVASGIAEQYERPVFLWGREGSDVLKGSCRGGPGNVHVVDLMQEARSTFAEFGGHSAAGGFSITTEQVFTLEQALCEALSRLPENEGDNLFSRADAELTLAEATHSLLTNVERLAPFGMQNAKPTFVFRGVPIKTVSWFGKGEEHLRLTLHTEEQKTVEAISFYARRQLGRVCETLSVFKSVTILATLEKDIFSKGRPVRLRLLAIAANQ
jgi:single-stranded-DNA-specific exonuclease